MKKFSAIFLVASATGLGSPTLADAATAVPHFTCNPAESKCYCTPDIEGDCDAMKINCKDGTITNCITVGPLKSCACDMARVGATKDKLKGKLDKNLPTLVPQ